MGLSHVDGNRFKQMIMKASGTKGYLSSSVQGALRETGANKLLKSGIKVSRRQATKVMQHLKSSGLTSHMGSTATGYIRQAFTKEERRQENIKSTNLQSRQKEMSDEKAAEQQANMAKLAGKSAKTTTSSMKAVQLAATHLPNIGTGENFTNKKDNEGTVRAGHGLPQPSQSTPAKTAPKQPNSWPEDWQKQADEINDLAID